MKEEFRDIEGYEGLYQISNLGRVKSFKGKKERVLKSAVDSAGYLMVVLCNDSTRKTYRIHKLVAINFLNHKPDGYKLVVDHIDNNKLNNNIDNLQLITPRKNLSKDRGKFNDSSRHIGVCFHKTSSKWLSRICINGKSKHLGLFQNELEASNAYQTALKNL